MESTVMERTSLDKLMDVLDEIRYDTMPRDVIEKADLCLTDFTGIFCGSTAKDMSKHLRGSLSDDLMKNPESLAMWMASSARMLDLDDGHRYAMAHPGVVINAAAIAMLVAGGCSAVSGRKLVEAIVKGYEVYCFQGRIINPGAYLKRGIDATCVCGAAAAAVTAATLMGLDREQTANAISYAASVAGGLNQSAIDGSAQKYLVAGAGAKLGIGAARMAAFGLGGPARVFEGNLGYANAFTPDPDMKLLNNPVLNWDIRYVYFKIHACVRRIHATLDCVKSIVGKNHLKESDIAHIEVGGGKFLCDAGTYRPKDNAQGQTSVPYTVALLLHYGSVEDDLVEENLANEDIHRLSEKVSVVFDEEIAKLAEKDKSLWGAARVTLTTGDGREFTEKRAVPGGDTEEPFSMDILREKFVNHAKMAIPERDAEQFWSCILHADEDGRPSRVFEDLLERI